MIFWDLETLDKFDQQILTILRTNARLPIATIAEKVSLSRSAVSERIKKMENDGTIKGYQVLVGESQKSEVSAYFEVTYGDLQCSHMAETFRAIPEVKLCHGVSGATDMLVYVQARNMQKLHEIRDRLASMSEIHKIKTHIVMSEWINNL